MQRHRYKILVLAAFSLSTAANGQALGPAEINAGGGTASASGLVHEFAIGSVVSIPALSSASLVITPGVLQPDNPTGIKTEIIPARLLAVFPTPMETTVNIAPSFPTGGNLGMRLLDASGKLVLDRRAILATGTERQSLNIEQLAAGNYFLHVSWTATGRNEQQSSFKLQKLR